MIPFKILLFLFSLKTAMSTCHCENKKNGFTAGRRFYTVSRLGKLPPVVNESSGLEKAKAAHTYWTHNDQGIGALYKINETAQVTDTLVFENLKNQDWEDLAQDEAGNIYIGDFGNNSNARKNLAIHKVNPEKKQAAGQILFRYNDQAAFPPEKKERNFDCEAFFWHADSLYLFSKNRGDKQVKLYSLPDTPGEHVTQLNGKVYLKSQTTAADINPSRTMMAVLSYGKIFLFRISSGKPMLNNPYLCIRLPRGQTEALVFVNDTDFLITNEKGKLFMIKRK